MDICGFIILRLDFSPIKGPEGNIEYLIYLQKDKRTIDLDEKSAEQLLESSINNGRDGYYNGSELTYNDICNIVDKAHEEMQ